MSAYLDVADSQVTENTIQFLSSFIYCRACLFFVVVVVFVSVCVHHSNVNPSFVYMFVHVLTEDLSQDFLFK